MNCRNCGAPLPPEARFCGSCGAPVELRCRSCAAPLVPGARFCSSCGTPVAGTQAADTGPAQGRASERKIATLLFADLVGYTSLGEQRDPEIVRTIVGEVFERLSQEVARYEGTVEKFAGDAMLAAFGVPTAHEDDAERAVRAALEMQVAVGDLAARTGAGEPGLELRIGVETGEVLVDLARAGSQRDLFVTGDAVNTAARLQQAAAPGTVVVGPAAYAATRHIVEYEELPTAVLKGKHLPVAAWRAIAVKARRGGRWAPLGIEAPLVGRDAEVGLLKETVRRTVADGRPHLVTVLGAAGVGKSRLTWELEKYLDGLPEAYHWRKGRCLAYAQTSYSALAEAVKADATIMDDDAPETGLAKLDARVSELFGDSPDPAVRRALQALLALGPAGGLPRDELFEAWRRYLDAIARLAPLVLVLEDLHWADEGLLDFVEFHARWGEGATMILAIARHELLERRPAWGGGLPNAATIVLEPLAADDTGRLVDGLVGGAIPGDLRARIVELADGNALFAEELVRMFVDRGVLRSVDGRWELARPVEDLEVPGSVHAVLAARLDGLPSAEKRLAQNAAVVGRIFWDAVLSHLARQGSGAIAELLRRLRVKELVVAREPSSLAGASEFGFRHVLIRDVAYESLPKRDRSSIHLEVAAWAEHELAGRDEEFVELFAAHYLAALRYEEEFAGPADGPRLEPLRRRVLDHAGRAARRAFAIGQFGPASDWMRVAVDQARLLALPPRELGTLVEEYAGITWGNEVAARSIEAARAAVDAMLALTDPDPDDVEMIARLKSVLGRALYYGTRVEESRAVLHDGIAALEGRGPSAGRAALLATLGWTYWRGGPIEEAIEPLQQAIAEARTTGAAEVERAAIHDLGIALASTGEARRGIELVEESRRLALEAGDANLLARCGTNLPSLLIGLGEEWERPLALLEDARDRSRRGVFRGPLAWNCGNLAELLVPLGRVREATTAAEEGLAAATALGEPALIDMRRAGLAWCLISAGERDRAIAMAASLGPSMDEPQMRTFRWLWDALLRWPADPAAAAAGLHERVSAGAGDPNAEIAAHYLARMAFRLGRGDIVRQVADQEARRTAGIGIWPRLEAEAIRLIADADEPAVAGLDRVGRELEELGYRLVAAEVAGDAALLAARLGLPDSALLERALALYASCEAVPLLGALPERRWTDPSRQRTPAAAS